MSKPLDKIQNTGKNIFSFSFVQVQTKCSKKDCHSCPHGPYWYARYREGDKIRAIYVGRSIPEDILQVRPDLRP